MDYFHMIFDYNLISHTMDHEHTIWYSEKINRKKRIKLTGIQWQLKVNLETSSHIPARHGLGSHGFVQFCRWISK